MVEKNPEKDILVDPQWTKFIDGLGYTFVNLGGMPGKDKNGEEIITFTLKTDSVIRKRYNLRGGYEVDDQNNVKLTVKKVDLILLNPYDEANRKWLYVRDFRGNDTTLSLRERDLKIEHERLKHTISMLQANILKLREENATAILQPAKYIKAGTQVYKDVMEGIASSLIKKKDE